MEQHHLVHFADKPGGIAHSTAKPLRVGLLGLGNVGGGTYRVLQRNRQLIRSRAGRDIIIKTVSVRNLSRAAGQLDGDVVLVQDPSVVVNDPDIDVIVEAIGGIHPARDLVLQAISNGKHVVTANKALLAEHGSAIFGAARQAGVVVAYEGAVAVSIPIIKALREGLTANRIEWVAGIINGTTNFILSSMVDKGSTFADALLDAQRLGYAEADPRLDVEGIDAAHKLALLAANAFGVPIPLDKIHVQGIAELDSTDVAIARRMGYCTKLLGLARREAGGLDMRVQPMLIPEGHLLAQVNGSMNGVMVKSDPAGVTLYYGAGAGAEQTASAVIADLVDLCRSIDLQAGCRVPSLAFQPDAMEEIAMVPLAEVVGSHYLRVGVAGSTCAESVLRELLSRHGVAVNGPEMVTHHGDGGEPSVAMLVGPVDGAALCQLTDAIEALPMVVGRARRIPVGQWI